MVALALWHLTLTPGEQIPIFIKRDFIITNAALGEEVADENSRSTIKVSFQPVNPRELASESGSDSDDFSDDDDEMSLGDSDEDEVEDAGDVSQLLNGEKKVKKVTSETAAADASMEGAEDEDEEIDEDDDDFSDEDEPAVEAVLCSLTPGKIEQYSLNLTMVSGDVVLFEVSGKNVVHLMGNYLNQDPQSHHDHDHDDYDDMSDEDLYEDEEDEEDYSDEELGLTEEQEESMRKALKMGDKKNKVKGSARIEEINDEAPINELPSKKRKATEAEIGDVSTASTTDGGKAGADGLTKAERKRLNKKMKKEGGEGVQADVAAKKEVVSPAAPAKEEKKSEKKVDKVGTLKKTLPGGLIVEDTKIGDGPVAKPGKRLQMRYIGKLQNGKQFDACISGAPFSFRLGGGEVIKGWDQGLVGMHVGGERKLTIPAALAYGSSKQGGIPANSTLVFDVKLLAVK